MLLCGLIGVLIATTRPPQYEATAGLAVRDPGLSDLFSSTRTISPERYVVDQVEILRSDVVADRASEIAAASQPSVLMDAAEILTRTKINFDPDVDFIGISVKTGSPTNSQVVASSVALAYQGVVQAEADATTERLLSQLDRTIAEVDSELATLRDQTKELLESNPSSSQLDAQVDELIDELITLREVTVQPGIDELNSIEFIKQELEARLLIQDLQNASDEFSSLLRQQQEAANVRESLRLRRGEIAATAATSGSGVTLYSPASPGQARGISLVLAVQAGAVLGLLIGAAGSYYLAVRKLEFDNQDDPYLVLDAPLMGALPKAQGRGRNRALLPSRDAPGSVEAEAVRFVAAALSSGDNRFGRELRGSLQGLGSVAFVSARPGEGKSTVLANVAIEVAYQGRSVLVIDADFGHQRVSDLLVPDRGLEIGLTEAVRIDSVSLESAIIDVPLPGSSSLKLMSRGRIPVTGPDFFSAAATQDFIRKTSEYFDLVLIDTPAMLGVAYTSSIIQNVDRIVAVVQHRSSIAAVTDMQHRLQLNAIPLSGYVYNRGPSLGVRSGEASVADFLGVSASVSPSTDRWSVR